MTVLRRAEALRSVDRGFQGSEHIPQLRILHFFGAKPGHHEMKLRIDLYRRSLCRNLLGLLRLFPSAFFLLLFLSPRGRTRGRDLIVGHACTQHYRIRGGGEVLRHDVRTRRQRRPAEGEAFEFAAQLRLGMSRDPPEGLDEGLADPAIIGEVNDFAGSGQAKQAYAVSQAAQIGIVIGYGAMVEVRRKLEACVIVEGGRPGDIVRQPRKELVDLPRRSAAAGHDRHCR